MASQLDGLLETLTGKGDGALSRIARAETGRDVRAAMESGGIAWIATENGWNELRGTSVFFEKCTDHLKTITPPGIDDIDWSEVLRTQDLFGRYGNEIGSALLLAALPQTYATERGAKVLVGSRGLTTDLTRRIRGTAQFLMLVMLATSAKDIDNYESCNEFEHAPDKRRDAVRESWTPGRGVRWRVCATLRTYHEAIRRTSGAQAGSPGGVPLNQEDLLGALLTFSITVFEVLDAFGITWSDAEQLSYLRTWNLIGTRLGVDGLPNELAGTAYSAPMPKGLPHTVADARRVLQVIRSRNWKPLQSYPTLAERFEGTGAGIQLMAALFHELTSTLPGPLKRLPEMTIRQLAAPVVRDRLGLGDGGLPEALLAISPRRRTGGGRFTALQMPRRARSAWLRQAANTVSRAATVHFVRDVGTGPPFVIPGLTDWTDGWRSGTEPRHANVVVARNRDLERLRLKSDEPPSPTAQAGG